ncbi:MAG: hypothetical protein IKM08_05565 [Clostridia bacterium]|nr:hypothetical protein [Clostridia bacterium]
MHLTEALKEEMRQRPSGEFCPDYFRAMGYASGTAATPAGKRADGIAALLTGPEPHIYQNDLIVGSIRPLFVMLTDAEREATRAAVAPYPERRFISNKDHYAPDYETVLSVGIGGLLAQIAASKAAHADDAAALDMLDAMAHTLQALQAMLRAYAKKANTLMGIAGYDNTHLAAIAQNCLAVSEDAPKTFAEGLQLLWMIHTCFLYEGRYAMAFGRWDQLLYPLYRRDVERGTLTADKATELLENVFVKICERRFYRDGDDVVNICIGGVDANGNNAVNDISYCMLEAVRGVNLPGPNLSARIAPDTPDVFLDACLKVIGTGLGYPALMNDTVNMAALRRYGYDEVDVRNYSMVGCIENFMTGLQPPWSDGRFDTPRFLEYLLLDGEGYDKGRKGLTPPPLAELDSMDAFMAELERQLSEGVKAYMDNFNAKNVIRDPENHTSPFLSCFCRCCIERGRDINMGGAKYPSVHGAALMGVGTMSDALAAIEQVVFTDRAATLSDIAEAMRRNFEGYADLRSLLLAAPKYGNDHPLPDKYAVWFTSFLSNEFAKYRTYDGGGIYIAMAANVSNIDAGHRIGATPDGRLAGEPLSDAASPTYGRDRKGVTATLLSLSKPDYTQCACGTVVNQKLSPDMFEDGQRQNLLALIRVYFAKGGQEIQINATSTEILRDAIKHPERYASLVVRVSGFSALYVTLDREVQEDILRRTQQKYN